jgi:cysteine desulfurase
MQSMSKTKSIYLDHAAATPVSQEVQAAMLPYLGEQFANPSSLYRAARDSRMALEDARHRVAMVLGAKPAELVFTGGGTESVNLAIMGVARQFPKSHVVSITTEHHAVLACIKQLQTEGHSTSLVNVQLNGLVEASALSQAITDETVMVAISYANNEIGVIQPLADIARMIAEVRIDRTSRGVDRPIYLYSDASQAGGLLDLHVSRLGVDLMTLSGSKIYGPRHVGVLYIRAGVRIGPISYGGGQERGLRSGTEDVAGAVGLATALEITDKDRSDEAKRLTMLRDHLLGELKKSVPNIIVNGDLKKRLASNINLSIPGIFGEDLVLSLDQAGVQASTGAACSIGRAEPSHVLLAIGRTESESNSSLRLTLGKLTHESDILPAAQIIAETVQKLRARA